MCVGGRFPPFLPAPQLGAEGGGVLAENRDASTHTHPPPPPRRGAASPGPGRGGSPAVNLFTPRVGSRAPAGGGGGSGFAFVLFLNSGKVRRA